MNNCVDPAAIVVPVIIINLILTWVMIITSRYIDRIICNKQPLNTQDETNILEQEIPEKEISTLEQEIPTLEEETKKDK